MHGVLGVACVCCDTHVGARGLRLGVSSLLPVLYGASGLNSSRQASAAVCFLRRLTHPGRNFVCNRFNCAFIFYHWLAFYFSSQLSLSPLNLSVNLYSCIYNNEEDISHGKLFFPA